MDGTTFCLLLYGAICDEETKSAGDVVQDKPSSKVQNLPYFNHTTLVTQSIESMESDYEMVYHRCSFPFWVCNNSKTLNTPPSTYACTYRIFHKLH